MPTFNQAWQDWLSENISLGCSQESIVQAMINAGFEFASAYAIVTQNLKNGSQDSQQKCAEASAQITSPYVYEPSCVNMKNYRVIDHHRVKVLAHYKQPEVIIWGDVLSHDECDEIMSRCYTQLQRSTTINPLLGTADVIERRTSEGTYFKRCEDEFVTRIDQRIAQLMSCPIENGEGLQILRYGIGGEYRPHFDYFPPEQQGSQIHISSARGGQRVATLIVYLNDVAEGGETIFPKIGLSVVPQKGNAVYFRYCNSQNQLDPLTLHGGAPVIAGEKWIMTKWMRQYAYG